MADGDDRYHMGSRFWPRSAAPRRKQGKVAILGGAAGGFFCEGGVKMVIFLYEKRGGEQKSTAKASCNDLLLLAMLLLPLLSCSLSLLLAFGCSSCTARELAALLPHPQQIKKACTAQRTVTNRFAVHRWRHMILFRRLRQPMLQLRPRAARL